MPTRALPPSVATAALLKSQLDQGHDYFDLLAPFVQRAVMDLRQEVIEPRAVRENIQARVGLDVPLRTLVALLERLSRRKDSGVRKEGGAYLRSGSASSHEDDAAPLIRSLNALGESFAKYCGGRLPAVRDADAALGLLCGFLEAHSATLVLDGPQSAVRTARREDIIVASFLTTALGSDTDDGHALLSLLQGLVLARAVTLQDLAEIERRLSELVVYFDTPFVLSLAGLYGPTDHAAAQDAVRLLKDLGATPAVFDATVAEVRRILGVYEDRLDTAAGRQSLYWTPLTAFLLSTNATGADVRTRSALLEATLGKEGLVIHTTPPRQREYVGDEIALAGALEDIRGEGHEARERHDLNCVASILTLRRGRQVEKLEDARAVLAATGMVVQSVRAWWRETGGSGLPPVLEYSAIINYCWVKRPRTAGRIHRFELAALCATLLRPSPEAWDRFRKELKKMAADGHSSREEAAVVLIDSYASKLLVQHEESETIGPGTVADIVQRVRDEHRRETESARTEVARERSARLAERAEVTERFGRLLTEKEEAFSTSLSDVVAQLAYERDRSDSLQTSIAGIARILAWIFAFPILGLAVAIVAVVAVFPFISSASIPPALQTALQVLTVLVSFLGGAFGLSAFSFGRKLQQSVERRIYARLVVSGVTEKSKPHGGSADS